MTTIKDYLTFYKNITFDEATFNEMDNILFAELSYLNWKNIVTSKKINLIEAISLYLNKRKKDDDTNLKRGILENINIIKNSLRYANCYLSDYIKIVNKSQQFGALCIYINSKTLYVSFEGTDGTIIGWKEDFMMTYTFPIESQKSAINYLNDVYKSNLKTIYVGGHSKGGNLAVTASMFAKKAVKDKIKTIFSNDGPGFMKEIFDSKEFQGIKDKIKLFIPQGSVVGQLMYNAKITKVVHSNRIALFDHDCNTWECFGPYLIETVSNPKSINVNKKTQKWLAEYDQEKRHKMIDTIFTILEECNIERVQDLEQLNYDKVKNIILHTKNADDETKTLILNSLKQLLLKQKKVNNQQNSELINKK